MNCDLDALRAFLAVADTGSFRAAAAALHLSPSALSRRIERLETGLSIRLFERSTRKVELTTPGRSFVPRARHVLYELDEALLGIGEVAERLGGEVAIACVPSAVAHFLPPVLRRFHAAWPGIRVRVVDESSIDILGAVARADVDFGLTYLGAQEPDLVFEPLLVDPFVLACPGAHPLSARRRVHWEELDAHDVIALAPGTGNRLLIDLALARRAPVPRRFCTVNHVAALLAFVEAGLGVGVVPRMALPRTKGHNQAVVGVPLADPSIERTLGLICRRGRELAPASRKLYDLLLAARGSVRGSNSRRSPEPG